MVILVPNLQTLEMNKKQIESTTGVSIEITKILEKDINRKQILQFHQISLHKTLMIFF